MQTLNGIYRAAYSIERTDQYAVTNRNFSTFQRPPKVIPQSVPTFLQQGPNQLTECMRDGI